MKKVNKILILLILIGIFIIITLSRYVASESDISRKLGEIWSGSQISTYNYRVISKNFEHYVSILKEKNYEEAYKYLPYEYKQYKDFDNYIKDMEKIDYNDFQVINIIKRTENMYSIY